MDGELRNMVMAFRVTELQTLLAFAGKNKTGRKNELQARALELVKSRPNHVVTKIHDLYRSIQVAMNSSGLSPYGANSVPPAAQPLARPYSSVPLDKQNIQPRPQAQYNSYPQKASHFSFPLCPDVKFKTLPFYDKIDELIKPSSLIPVPGSVRLQEKAFSFCLTPAQARDTAASKEYIVTPAGEQRIQYGQQVQLRFCVLETSSDQDDAFPPSINVKVNGKPIPLPHPIPSNRPGVEAKRPPRPLNVTNFVKLSPTCTNTVTVTWATDATMRGYAMALYLVKKLYSDDLLARLRAKGPKPADYTRGMIKELIGSEDGECCIATGSLKVSIACPLGKSRMSLPCRPRECTHLQCFDAIFYIQMNERKPTWNCPVCDKSTLFENLSIDGYFSEVVNKMSESEGNEIEVLPDGSWRSAKALKTESEHVPAKRPKFEINSNATICLDDDDILEELSSVPLSFLDKAKKESEKKDFEVIDILSSSEEEEEGVSPIKRRPKAIDDEEEELSSSSSSATTDGEQEKMKKVENEIKNLQKAVAQAQAQRTVMDVITLDSRSPTPEPTPPQQNPQQQMNFQTQQRQAQIPTRLNAQPPPAHYQNNLQNSRYHPYANHGNNMNNANNAMWSQDMSQTQQGPQHSNNNTMPHGSLYNPFEEAANNFWPFHNDPWGNYGSNYNPFEQGK